MHFVEPRTETAVGNAMYAHVLFVYITWNVTSCNLSFCTSSVFWNKYFYKRVKKNKSYGRRTTLVDYASQPSRRKCDLHNRLQACRLLTVDAFTGRRGGQSYSKRSWWAAISETL